MPAPENTNPWLYLCTSCDWSQESHSRIAACPECGNEGIIGTRETTEETTDWLIGNHRWLTEHSGPDSDYAGMWVVLDGGTLVGAYETIEELMDAHGKGTGYLVTQVL